MRVLRRKNRGFTLIEMLIVMMLFCVISLAIYGAINNGIKIWLRINQAVVEEDIAIFFDKFAVDLRNSFEFTGVNFLGSAEEVEFAALTDSQRLKNKTVGKIIYAYDPQAKILSRKVRDFAHLFEDKDGPVRQMLRDLKSLQFSYYLYDGEKKEYLWQDELVNAGLPLAVRIKLELEHGAQANIFTRTVNIPAAR